MNDETPSQPQPPAAQGVSTPFFALVAGMLLIILAAVAFLFVRERRAHAADLQVMARMQKDLQRNDRIAGLLKDVAFTIKPVQSAEITRKPVTIDGREVEAQVISEDVGGRIGLRSGVVVIVPDIQPTSAPTRPATEPKLPK